MIIIINSLQSFLSAISTYEKKNKKTKKRTQEMLRSNKKG